MNIETELKKALAGGLELQNLATEFADSVDKGRTSELLTILRKIGDDPLRNFWFGFYLATEKYKRSKQNELTTG